MLDGGPGRDTLSYEHRAAPVIVTLGNAEVAGAPGEGDEITALEYLEGGSGDDVLIAGGPRSGYGYAHGLDGGPGDDRLVGSRRSDRLTGGEGTDVYTCGAGDDIVVDADPGERIGGACDDAIWFFGERSREFLSPSPVAVGRERATFRVECPSDDLSKGEPLAGRGSLTLSTPAGRRLGRGTFADAGGFGRFRVRVALTRLGRRLAARQGGTRASVALRGPGIPPRTWTIALRVG